MSDLIYRQEAIGACEAIRRSAIIEDGEPLVRKSAVKYVLEKLTSAQPKIIRCKDCLYYHEEKCPMTYTEWISWEEDGYIEHDDVLHDNAEDDGYCHKWERRTDEQTVSE